jgi:hypothetical protein
MADVGLAAPAQLPPAPLRHPPARDTMTTAQYAEYYQQRLP